MNSQMSGPQMAQMKWMMYLMPIMFLGFFNNYASRTNCWASRKYKICKVNITFIIGLEKIKSGGRGRYHNS